MQYIITHPIPTYSGNYNGLQFRDGVAKVDGPLAERSMGDTAEEIAVFLREHGFEVTAVESSEPVSMESDADGDPVELSPLDVKEISTGPEEG